MPVWKSFIRLSFARNASTISTVLSVEQSSTTTSSQFPYVWAMTEFIDSPIVIAALRAGIMTETNLSSTIVVSRLFLEQIIFQFQERLERPFQIRRMQQPHF